MSKAFVTLATNDSYALGALVLARSLETVGSTFPAVVLVTDDVSTELLDRLALVFKEVVSVSKLDSNDAKSLELLKRPELGVTLTKLHLWKLSTYSKVVFLDADVLVIKNIDALFNEPEFSAAPDVGWPDCFNSGVFVAAPSIATYEALTALAEQHGSFDGGDQGLLNEYFKNWNRISFAYNVTPTAFYSYAPAFQRYFDDIKAVHFIGSRKPWHSRVAGSDSSQGLLDLWWRIHDQFYENEPTSGLYATTQASATSNPRFQTTPGSSSSSSSSSASGQQQFVGVDPKTLQADRLSHLNNFINYRVTWTDHDLESELAAEAEQPGQTRTFNTVTEFRQAIVEEMRAVNNKLEQLRLDSKKNEKLIERLQERNSELAETINRHK